jgi:hypothetical protein
MKPDSIMTYDIPGVMNPHPCMEFGKLQEDAAKLESGSPIE